MMMFPGQASIKPQPRGVVLIVGSDRNPVGSVLCPLVSAVASGNGVMVKVSEHTPKCAQVVHLFVSNFLDNRFYQCIAAEKTPAETIAELPLDMICYTGEESRAKKVMLAASSNLVPVHLEIENLCPTVVDGSANLEMAAAK